MDDKNDPRMFVFPAVQEHEQIELVLQSLSPIRRRLDVVMRRKFDMLLHGLHRHLPAYQDLRHLTPIEFILLALLLEMLERIEGTFPADHPPFP